MIKIIYNKIYYINILFGIKRTWVTSGVEGVCLNLSAHKTTTKKGGMGVASVGRGWREAELRSVIGSKQELLLPSLSAHFNDCCGGPSRPSLKLSHSECLKDSRLNHLPSLNSSAATLHSNYKGILVKGHFLKAANSWPSVHQKKKKKEKRIHCFKMLQ